jgi:uncharacterized protein YggU (UPF0235/DUF167 family)
VDGQANDAVIKLLAKQLGIAQTKLEIVHGARNRQKLIEIQGLNLNSVMERLRN